MAKMVNVLSSGVFLLMLGLAGRPALSAPRYYTCGYNGPVTTQDRCPDGTTPFLHLGTPPGLTTDPSPKPVADLCDSTSDPYTCKWKRYKAFKCNENPNYYYCDNFSLTQEQVDALARQWEALKSQYYFRSGSYWLIR